MKDRHEYDRQYYLANKPRLAAKKAWQQKHDLHYRLRALLATINQRCNNPRHATFRWYGAKGIRNQLTLANLIYLWHRDCAGQMKKPSIDREDSGGDYSLENCCFRELYDNQKRGWLNKPARTLAIREGMNRENRNGIDG